MYKIIRIFLFAESFSNLIYNVKLQYFKFVDKL